MNLCIIKRNGDIKPFDKNVIFDGLYSASIGYFDKILAESFRQMGKGETVYESLVNNIITADEYQSMRKDYGDKISDAVKKIHNLETVQSEAEKKYNYYCDLSDAVEKIVKNKALKKELIGKLIDKIYVYKGRKVEIIYNFENEYESEVATNA